MNKENITKFTTDIVAAYVGNNTVVPTDLTQLITSIYFCLESVGDQALAARKKPEPAVSIHESIENDAITCLDCGFKGKMLKRHFRTKHNLTPQEYRARWGLATDYPIISPAYAQRRKELVPIIGLGRKPGKTPKHKSARISKKIIEFEKYKQQL